MTALQSESNISLTYLFARQSLIRVLRVEDTWGFESMGECLQAIATHDDFADRWEGSPTSKRLAQGWKDAMRQYGIDTDYEILNRLCQALRNEDIWGFDTLAECLHSIATHADFATLWDVNPSTVILANTWRNCLSNAGIVAR